MRADLIINTGDDLLVVNAARVSMDKHHEEFMQNDKGLLNYLARHKHWTPFGHPSITIRERVPIFVARQRFKHMIGFVYNEVSRRYVDSEPEFFFPPFWRERPSENIKQGSGGRHSQSALIENMYRELMDTCKQHYMSLIDRGVAPEQARMLLPQSMYTEYYVTGTLYAWARAYLLRVDSHAQKEIQDLSHMWNNIIKPLYPHSWEALTNDVSG